MKSSKFGDYLKYLRAQKGMTLRGFCRAINKDPGNISKIERGLLPPPKEETIRQFAKALGLKENSKDFQELLNLGSLEAGRIPESILDDAEIMDKLPIFFRTATGSKLDKEKLESFLKDLKES